VEKLDMKTKALVITGDGINCERESARAFHEAGGEAFILHVNELLENPKLLREFAIFCLPGGFSFGDELRSGKILAEKMRSRLGEEFETFTKKGGFTIGVCNGFQVLIQLGAFTGISVERETTLATNDHGTFLDRWTCVEITREASASPWFKGMSGKLMLPIRHKEGRIVLKSASAKTYIPLRYEEAVNGSFMQAAALMDSTGQILGLMPHPEAATHAFLNPCVQTNDEKNLNALKIRKLFENAVQGAKR
jgi:phosphoribosylformylglycinamidine (FGAM) synthase-like amidotransferase family enzyme